MTLQLPFGKSLLDVTIPKSWTIAESIEPKPFRKETVIEQELERMLNHPIGMSSPLSRDYTDLKVCVVVDDDTRPTPVSKIFPFLYRCLEERGMRSENLTVLVACGAHAAMDFEAIHARLGMHLTNSVRIVNHNCFSEVDLRDLGRSPSGMRVSVNKRLLDADAVFLVGTIEPHIMAGYGGGLKNIVPGCAGLHTIIDTHLLGPASERFGNVGRFREACKVRQRIEEAALMVRKNCFLINTVLDPFGKILGVFCGDPVTAFDQGCRLAKRAWGAAIHGPKDILIVSSNPMNYDLCQASKAFGTGIQAVREGGLIIACFKCEQGLGDYSVSPTKHDYEKTRNLIRSSGTEEYVRLKERESGRSFPFYETFLTQSNGEALRKADIFLYSRDIPLETLRSFGLFKAFDDMDELISEAQKLYPEAEVIVSPFGGACFPIF